MESGSTRLWVVPRAGSGWDLRETVAGPVLSSTATKREALSRAFVMLEQGRGGELVVARADGSEERRVVVDAGAPRPWWYLRPGFPRLLVLVVIGLQLVLRLVAVRPEVLSLVLTGLVLVLFVGAVGAALRSRALDRSRGMSRLE